MLICERPGCNTKFCYHCKQEWHANQTCDAARLERLPLLRLSLSDAKAHSGNYPTPRHPINPSPPTAQRSLCIAYSTIADTSYRVEFLYYATWFRLEYSINVPLTSPPYYYYAINYSIQSHSSESLPYHIRTHSGLAFLPAPYPLQFLFCFHFIDITTLLVMTLLFAYPAYKEP